MRQRHRLDEKPASWWWIAFGIIITVAFVVIVIVVAGKNDPAPQAGRVATLINRLNGVVYYDPDDSPSQDQMAAFGSYWSQLNTVNCRARADYCESLGIEEAPTILIPGFAVGISGYQDLADLELLLSQIETDK